MVQFGRDTFRSCEPSELAESESSRIGHEASFYIEVPDDLALVESMSSIRSQLTEDSSVTFVDQDNALG